MSHARPFSIGLNCALGAGEMRQHVRTLSEVADTRVSAYPNAGLPNEMGGYDETPDETASTSANGPNAGLVNIVGGCCGTTPDHIRAIAQAVEGKAPRKVPPKVRHMRLCGLEMFEVRGRTREARGAPHDRHREFHQYRRTDKRHRLGQVQEADHGGRLCRRARRRPQPGRERRPDHRRQHGRGPARLRARR